LTDWDLGARGRAGVLAAALAARRSWALRCRSTMCLLRALHRSIAASVSIWTAARHSTLSWARWCIWARSWWLLKSHTPNCCARVASGRSVRSLCRILWRSVFFPPFQVATLTGCPWPSRRERSRFMAMLAGRQGSPRWMWPMSFQRAVRRWTEMGLDLALM